MTHKAGFVNIIGNPNVGKSTLMNLMVGERISIITSKSQTTRHRIMGIVNADDYQIVYSDTPGMIKPNYKLQESMMKFAHSAFEDADILVYVTDVHEKRDKNIEIINKISHIAIPVIVVVNKIDLTDQESLALIVEAWNNLLPNAEILPVSALHKFNHNVLLNKIISLLPESPPLFEKDQLTDKPMRFFVSEIIREKILLYYEKEIPYSVEIEIEQYKDEAKIVRISAVIYVMRDSQKGILIGHQGSGLKRVGTEARKDIEAFLGKKVFIEIFVKVRKDWRDNENMLKNFGYEV